MKTKIVLVTTPTTFPVRFDCISPDLLARIRSGSFTESDAGRLCAGIDFIRNRTGVPRYTHGYGVLSLIAYLRQSAGDELEVSYLDGFGPAVIGYQQVMARPVDIYENQECLIRFGLTPREIARRLAAEQPQIVGLNCFASPFHNDLIDVARAVREELPGALVVAGGLHPTALHDYLAAHPAIDVVVRGEGEETLRELALAVRHRRPLTEVRGLTLCENAKVVVTPNRPYLDIERLPWIARDTIYANGGQRAVDRYGMWDAAHEGGSMDVIQASRGCIVSSQQCKQCVSGHAFGPIRRRSSESLVDEIGEIVAAGARMITEQSDQVLLPRRRFLEMCRLLERRGLAGKVAFATGNGLWLNALAKMDDQDFELMLRVGFRDLTIDIGGAPALVELAHERPIHTAALTAVLERLRAVQQRTGLIAVHRAFLIVSGPGTTRTMNRATVTLTEQLAEQGLIDGFDPFIATMLPGSALFATMTALLRQGVSGSDLFEQARRSWRPANDSLGLLRQLEELRLWPRFRFGRENFAPLFRFSYDEVYDWYDSVYHQSRPQYLNRRIG